RDHPDARRGLRPSRHDCGRDGLAAANRSPRPFARGCTRYVAIGGRLWVRNRRLPLTYDAPPLAEDKDSKRQSEEDAALSPKDRGERISPAQNAAGVEHDCVIMRQ